MDASVAYKLEKKVWRKNKEWIGRIKEKKEHIFKEIKKELGLIVDMAKPGGSGTTNDGNTSRVAFQNHEKFAAIFGINPVLVENLYVILCALSSQEAVDPGRFQVYCRETAEL